MPLGRTSPDMRSRTWSYAFIARESCIFIMLRSSLAMPNIRLPDGSSKSFPGPVTVAEIAQAIGPGLARAALAGRVNGKLVDTSHRIDRDAEVSIITERDREGVEILRHSTAHL